MVYAYIWCMYAYTVFGYTKNGLKLLCLKIELFFLMSKNYLLLLLEKRSHKEDNVQKGTLLLNIWVKGQTPEIKARCF